MAGEIRFGPGADKLFNAYLKKHPKETEKNLKAKIEAANVAGSKHLKGIDDHDKKGNVILRKEEVAEYIKLKEASQKAQIDIKKPQKEVEILALDKINAAAVKAIQFNEMVAIQGGTYKMGETTEVQLAKLKQQYGEDYNVDSDEIPHNVTVSDFEMGKYEVTPELFEKVMDFNPASNKADVKNPTERVSWFEANEFCLRISYLELADKNSETAKILVRLSETAKKGRDSAEYKAAMVEYNLLAQKTKGLFRLPTEAEWEYAAGDKIYSGSDSLKEVANVGGGSTVKVGTLKANELGLHDMSGNVWEWNADWHGPLGADDVKDPKGADSGDYRVLRGGGWSHSESSTRSANRGRSYPGSRSSSVGFRVSRTGK